MRVIVIEFGFSGLTSAALLAKEGHEVIVFEQHEKIEIPHKFEFFRDDLKTRSIEHLYNFFKKG